MASYDACSINIVLCCICIILAVCATARNGTRVYRYSTALCAVRRLATPSRCVLCWCCCRGYVCVNMTTTASLFISEAPTRRVAVCRVAAAATETTNRSYRTVARHGRGVGVGLSAPGAWPWPRPPAELPDRHLSAITIITIPGFLSARASAPLSFAPPVGPRGCLFGLLFVLQHSSVAPCGRTVPSLLCCDV